MQIPIGHITEAWTGTVQKTKTEHKYFGPDQKNGAYVEFRYKRWKRYSLLLSPAFSKGIQGPSVLLLRIPETPALTTHLLLCI